MNPNPTRRAVLQFGIAVMAGGVLVRDVAAAQNPRPGAFRVAHLTDMHVKPQKRREEGYIAALRSLEKIDPPPQMLITGGDHIMDALATDRDAAQTQWELYRKTLTDNTKLKTYPVMGNHDVWGWTAKDDHSADAGYGKSMALDHLGVPKSYYSFDAGGWHFVALDNIQQRQRAYFGDLDAEQLEWLKGDLATAKSPVCVVTHIPLVSACAMFFKYGFNESIGNEWKVGDNLLHHDVKPLLKILAANNVKLCLSGHIHLLDHVQFMGVHFICDGAVSGNWWGGPFQETPEGYGIVDFYPDGTFEHQYLTYGWKAK